MKRPIARALISVYLIMYVASSHVKMRVNGGLQWSLTNVTFLTMLVCSFLAQPFATRLATCFGGFKKGQRCAP